MKKPNADIDEAEKHFDKKLKQLERQINALEWNIARISASRKQRQAGSQAEWDDIELEAQFLKAGIRI